MSLDHSSERWQCSLAQLTWALQWPLLEAVSPTKSGAHLYSRDSRGPPSHTLGGLVEQQLVLGPTCEEADRAPHVMAVLAKTPLPHQDCPCLQHSTVNGRRG